MKFVRKTSRRKQLTIIERQQQQLQLDLEDWGT